MQDYNEMEYAIREVGEFVNEFVSTDSFYYTVPNLKIQRGQIIDDSHFDGIVDAISNV